MDIDTRPKAIDMSLCTQEYCPNKCKRYHTNWQPNKYWQSYIRPCIKYNKKGVLQPCKSRLEE